MDEKPYLRTPEELHHRQTWLEIWLPLILCLAVFITLLVFLILAASSGSASVAQLSAISIMFIILPLFFITLFAFGLVLVFNILLFKGNRALPRYGLLARQKVTSITDKVQQLLAGFVAAVLKVQSSIEIIFHFFSHMPKNEK